MLPFLFAFLDAQDSGLGWFVSRDVLQQMPLLDDSIREVSMLLAVAVFAAPVWLAVQLYRDAGRGLPLISWLIVATNGVWWIFFRFYDAFVWATVFHGLQYLAIVTIFHVKDQAALPGPSRSPLFRNPLFLAGWFYARCFALGYLLFYVWPFSFLLAGFPLSESMLLCAAVINIHHFIVDRYIWRLRSDRANAGAMER